MVLGFLLLLAGKGSHSRLALTVALCGVVEETYVEEAKIAVKRALISPFMVAQTLSLMFEAAYKISLYSGWSY